MKGGRLRKSESIHHKCYLSTSHSVVMFCDVFHFLADLLGVMFDVVWCFGRVVAFLLADLLRPSALSWTSACCRHGSQRKQRFGTNPLGSCRPWPFPIWPCLLWFCPKWPTSPRISAGFNIASSYFSCCSSADRLVLYIYIYLLFVPCNACHVTRVVWFLDFSSATTGMVCKNFWVLCGESPCCRRFPIRRLPVSTAAKNTQWMEKSWCHWFGIWLVSIRSGHSSKWPLASLQFVM